jgi:ribonuclease P protein subunit POP4
MSPLTQYNLGRHELIGLQVAVESERCDEYSRITGRIIDETKNMLIVFDGRHKRRIPKSAAAFRLTLPNHSTCLLEGKTILFRPEDRIKKFRGKKK